MREIKVVLEMSVSVPKIPASREVVLCWDVVEDVRWCLYISESLVCCNQQGCEVRRGRWSGTWESVQRERWPGRGPVIADSPVTSPEVRKQTIIDMMMMRLYWQHNILLDIDTVKVDILKGYIKGHFLLNLKKWESKSCIPILTTEHSRSILMIRVTELQTIPV